MRGLAVSEAVTRTWVTQKTRFHRPQGMGEPAVWRERIRVGTDSRRS
jgi:hypothetical protein